MKLIIAIVQPEELPDIKEELLKRKIYKFTVSSAKVRARKFLYRKFTEVSLTRYLCLQKYD